MRAVRPTIAFMRATGSRRTTLRVGAAAVLLAGGVAAASAATAAPACGRNNAPSAGCEVTREISWSRAVAATDGVCVRVSVRATLAAAHDRQVVAGLGRDRYGALVLRDQHRELRLTESCVDDGPPAQAIKVVSVGWIWARDADAGQRANSALQAELGGWGQRESARVAASDYAADYSSWSRPPGAVTSSVTDVTLFQPRSAQRLGFAGPGCIRLEVGLSVVVGSTDYGISATADADDTTFCL